MSIYYFSNNSFVMKHSAENEIPNFFLENLTFFSENLFFFPKIQFFLKNIRNLGFCPPTWIHYFSKNIRNPVFGHFPSFPASSFMLRVTYLQYLTQCGVKPGLYSVRRSTQMELLKRIYADTRVMAFILLRTSRRVCTQTYAIAVRAGSNYVIVIVTVIDYAKMM